MNSIKRPTKPPVLIGEYHHYPFCRFCESTNTEAVIDLGNMPLAGGFFKPDSTEKDFATEKHYPLVASYCPDCHLLQCDNIIDKDTLFKDYFYLSSSMKTLIDHFRATVDSIKSTLLPDPTDRFVVEVGANDGGMIQALTEASYKAVGVDPATNVVQPLIDQGLPFINAYFNEEVAQRIIDKNGQADAVVSFHAMAHIEDMHEVFRGIKMLLQDDGFLMFEVHYLGNLIEEMQYDMIYHEHQYYYSLLAIRNFMKQFDMEVFDVKRVPVRAGSIQFYVQHTGARPISENVSALAAEEEKAGYGSAERYRQYGQAIAKTKEDLLAVLDKAKADGKTIVGYGASGRGTIVMNYCGLSLDYLDYVVDDAPSKDGAFTPGTHHKIYPSAQLVAEDRPDYAVLFAWPFLEEVKKRNQEYLEKGGQFIVPLPEVIVVGK